MARLTWLEAIKDLSKGYYNNYLLAYLVSGKDRDGNHWALNTVEGGGLTPLGYQQITDLSDSEELTVPEGAVLAVIQAEAQAVRYRDDGGIPTASAGMPLAASATLVYNSDLEALRFIEQAGGAKLNILYYGSPA